MCRRFKSAAPEVPIIVVSANSAVDDKVRDRTNFTLEYGGLYRQQQESFNTLRFVLAAALLLVFLVLLIEFRSLLIPLAIVWGSLLSLLGVGLASFVLLVDGSQEVGTWQSAWLWGLAIVGLAALAGFAVAESRAEEPIVSR